MNVPSMSFWTLKKGKRQPFNLNFSPMKFFSLSFLVLAMLLISGCWGSDETSTDTTTTDTTVETETDTDTESSFSIPEVESPTELPSVKGPTEAPPED